MNITFLERFQGKTSTVSKLGIESALKGPQDHSLIYTNTHKSFATVPSCHFKQIKDHEDECKLSSKSDD